LETSNSLGLTRRINKWIFIGAKLSDKKREQQIKGVLTHELCHYVICLVYNNKFLPYYEDALDIRDKFEEVVNVIDKWSAEGSEYPDDECNENISSVFTCYDPHKFHLELIVRAVQIQVEFDDDEVKSKYLIEKYEKLFDFWKEHVLPDLQNYCKRNKHIIKLNKYVELLPSILKKTITIKNKKDVEALVQSTLSVAITNSSSLLFIDIIEHLRGKCGKLFDSQNFYTEPLKLNNLEFWNDFEEICKDAEQLNIFVDCTKGVPSYLGEIFVNKELNFTFIVSNKSQCQELMNICDKKGIKNATKVEMNYNWNDLTEESQNFLLKTKINFQNNLQITLVDLFKVKEASENNAVINMEKNILTSMSEIFDDQLLNLLINNKELSVNSSRESDPYEKYFEILNQSRRFLKKEKDVGSYGEGEFLSETNNKKFVLISDQAGNGKSWAMKNFTKILREQNPTRWVTYVDLKQFIKEFKARKDQPEFSNFMVENILKPEQKFESRIFQRLYKDGKVFILFDGFDEIAPDCAEFVSKLAQSFQWNKGNQLWIATRDYFEVDLQQKLQLDVSYGLQKMGDYDGIDMIAKSWMLMDLSHRNEVMTVEDFNKLIKDSSDFETYKEKAEQIVKKVQINLYCSVGMPQMYKMIADGFKNITDVNNLKKSKIYLQFVLNLYKRWSDEKGQIRKEASIESQQLELNFWKYHQFHAISSLFPELIKILFPGYNGSKLLVEEAIACGLMSIKNGEFYFIHETFREYFVADALAKALKNEEINEKFLEVLTEVLTITKFGVIKMFLNDSIDSTTLEKFKPQMRKFIRKFYEMETFVVLFSYNLENLTDFVISVFKKGDYNKVKEVLTSSSGRIAFWTNNSEMFFKFQDFLCEFLKTEDLKNLITKQEIFRKIIEGELKIEVFADFVLKIESKTGREFIQIELRNAISKGWIQNYPFRFFFHVSDLKAFKFQKFMEMLQKFLSTFEMLEFLKKIGIRVCVGKENKEILKIFWTEIENYFTKQNLKQDFKELVKHQDKCGENILHRIADCKNIDFCKEFWQLLLKTFEDREELKDLVLQKSINKYRMNFVHQFVHLSKNLEIIKWTLNMLKANFNYSQYQEFIQPRGQYNINLLHSSAIGRQNIETFEFLWEYFRDFCKSEQEFWKVVNEVDEDGRNILNCATYQSKVEIFNFLINKLEEKYSNEEIKKMLKNSDKWNRSLLHSSSSNSKYSDVFVTVWKTFQKYFNSAELLEIAKQVDDENAENFLFYFQSGATFEFAIEELEKTASRDEIRNMLSIQNRSNRNFLQFAALYERRYKQFCKTLWKTFQRFFIDSEILLLLKNVDIDGNNVLHHAVSKYRDKFSIIFIWLKIKTFMNRNEQIEYLRMKGEGGQNLLEFDNVVCYDRTFCQRWIKEVIDEYGIIL